MITVIPRADNELFIVNHNATTWWLECWTPGEGTAQASLAYYRQTKRPATPEAGAALAARWAGDFTAYRLRQRLSAPRYKRYGGL